MTPRLPLPIQPQSINPPPPQSPQVKREDLIDDHHSRDDLTSLKRRRLETVGSHSPVPRPSSAHTQQLSPNGQQQPPSPYHYPYSHTTTSTHHLQHPSAQLHQPPLPSQPPQQQQQQQQQPPPPPHHDYHYTHGPPISPNMTQAPPAVQTPTQTPLGLHQPHGGIHAPPPPPPPQTLIYPHQQYYSPYGVGDMRYPTPPQPMAHAHGPTGPMPPMGPPHSHLQHHHIPPPPPHLMGHQMQLGVAVPGPSFALRRPIPARQRTSIACRYCRRRKIRCSGFDPENPDSRCSNCIRFNQECVFIPVSSMASTDKKSGGADGAGADGVGQGPYDRLSPTLSDSDKREWKPQPHPTSPTEIRNAISPAISPSPPTAAAAKASSAVAASSASTSPTSATSSTAPTRSKLSIQNLLG